MLWEIELWPSTNGSMPKSIPYILVLAGSESIFTEIPEYKFIGLP